MQIVVKRSDANKDQALVLAWYEDGTVIDTKALGSDVVVLNLPGDAVDASSIPTKLAKGWREKYRSQIINSEAGNRVKAVFSEADQFEALAAVINDILQHGMDVNKWPQAAKDRKAQMDRTRTYLAEVRTKRASMAKGGGDPTHEANWPTPVGRWHYLNG